MRSLQADIAPGTYADPVTPKFLQRLLVVSTVARGYSNDVLVCFTRALTRRNTFEARPVESIVGSTLLNFTAPSLSEILNDVCAA